MNENRFGGCTTTTTVPYQRVELAQWTESEEMTEEEGKEIPLVPLSTPTPEPARWYCNGCGQWNHPSAQSCYNCSCLPPTPYPEVEPAAVPCTVHSTVNTLSINASEGLAEVGDALNHGYQELRVVARTKQFKLLSCLLFCFCCLCCCLCCALSALVPLFIALGKVWLLTELHDQGVNLPGGGG
jgi:hypothetical protein